MGNKILPFIIILSSLYAYASAAEITPSPAPIAAGALRAALTTPTPSPWSHFIKLSANISSVSVSNNQNSLDPAIGSASESASYVIRADNRLLWQGSLNSVQQDLNLRFGRTYTEETKWTDSSDEIEYNGVWKFSTKERHSTYTNLGYNSVFTGIDIDETPLDPGTGKASTGYSYTLTHKKSYIDKLDTRCGVRAQRRWGDNAIPRKKETETGIEIVILYEREQNKQFSYNLSYELFSEFDDLQHTSHLVTAGINYNITHWLAFKFDLRAYYESIPEDEVSTDNDPYDTLGIRQESLIGFTAEF
ncbi:MAG: DUF481 domain-containing protein [Planctomycetes bacterium]|nr:DUF481 domain-containing protein [Planctomycetota bacterium]